MEHTNQIEAICRYPIKGLAHEDLAHVDLSESSCMPKDRRYAITHADSQFDFSDPQWIARRNFLVVALSPGVAAIRCQFHHADESVTLVLDGRELARLNLHDPEVDQTLNRVLRDAASMPQEGPYRLVKLPDNTGLTDSPTPTLSLMNRQSLSACSDSMGVDIDQRRFRGNLWYNGLTPWEENDWVGQVLRIGDVQLRVTEPIVRCAAIDANPVSGERDVQLLKGLNHHFGHVHFGVLAEVISAGRVSVGDQLTRA